MIDTISGKEKLFEEYYFDERVKNICKSTQIPVGILIDKGMQNLEKVFVPIISEGDDFLLFYAQKLIQNNASQITCWKKALNTDMDNSIKELQLSEPENFSIIDQTFSPETILQEQNLVIISIETWKKLIDEEDKLLAHFSSVLIIKP